MSPASGSVSLLSKLNVLNADTLSPFDLANQINTAFIEPMQNFQALQSPPSCEFESTNALSVIEFDVFRALELEYQQGFSRMVFPTGCYANMQKYLPTSSPPYSTHTRDRAWRARAQKSAPQKLQIKLRKRRTRSAILIYNRG